MAAVAKAKNVAVFGAPAASEFISITYDFSVDAGATGALDLFTAKHAMAIKFAAMRIVTTCTSGGSATVSVGKSGDTTGLIAATAVASLTAGNYILGAATVDASMVVAADGKVQMEIGTAALTAGKIDFIFEIVK